MIDALLKYAETRGLASRPGYRKKVVKWLLQFDAEGERLLGVLPSDKEFPAAPDFSFQELRALGAKCGEAAHFLVAPLGTFLGWAKETGAGEDAGAKETARRATLVGMLSDAGQVDNRLAKVGEVLARDETRAFALNEIERQKPSPKPTDLATVVLGTSFPAEDASWHAWWDTFRASLGKPVKTGTRMINIATGEAVVAETTHPKITRLTNVGLSQPFAPIITFDKPAFESYGLGRAANAAMDAESAKAYVTAIDHLLENSVTYAWRRPKPGAKKQLAKDFARMGGARILYWYTGPTAAREKVEEEDVVSMLFGSVPQHEEPPESEADERILVESRLRSAIERIRTGEVAVDIGQVGFYMIALSGAGGRVMVRDFVQGSVLALAEAADKWFGSLDLVTWTGRPGRPPRLEDILTAPLPAKKPDQDYLKWVAPAGAWRQQLWRAALMGTPIPASAAPKCLLAHNSAVISGDLTDAEKGQAAQRRSRLRLALLKAYLLRKGVPMKPALDLEHPSPAYHCGRLLAAYDDLQRAALGDVGAGVVQRYYGGALTNPSGVFGQLSRLAMTHLGKLEGGLAYVYETRIAEIHNGIRRTNGRAAAYPSALNQVEQALFALGFWHQTAHENAERAKNSAAKKARDAAKAQGETHE